MGSGLWERGAVGKEAAHGLCCRCRTLGRHSSTSNSTLLQAPCKHIQLAVGRRSERK